MSKTRKYVDYIIANGKPEDMEKLHDIFEEVLHKLKEYNYDSYKYYKEKIYEIAYGKVLSEEMAHEWVENMKPYGMKWTLEETTRAMQDKQWNLDPIEFFVVCNMIFNDYNDIVLDNVDLNLQLAREWLKDTDVKDNKLYNYYRYVV